MNPFHLAIAVDDLEKAREFYTGLFGASLGRESDHWIDFNFFGHQLTAHLKPEEVAEVKANQVDGKNVPVRHFGIVLEWQTWHDLADKLNAQSIDFVIEPYLRFEGEVGEQATMFLLDPSGNAIEFKSFKDPEQLFAT